MNTLHEKQEIYKAGLFWSWGENYFHLGNILHNTQRYAISNLTGMACRLRQNIYPFLRTPFDKKSIQKAIFMMGPFSFSLWVPQNCSLCGLYTFSLFP